MRLSTLINRLTELRQHLRRTAMPDTANFEVMAYDPNSMKLEPITGYVVDAVNKQIVFQTDDIS